MDLSIIMSSLPFPVTLVDTAWYWLKCVLCSWWLCTAPSLLYLKEMWFIGCSCLYSQGVHRKSSGHVQYTHLYEHLTVTLSPGCSFPLLGCTVNTSLLTTSSSCLSTSSSLPVSAQYSGSRCMSIGNWNALWNLYNGISHGRSSLHNFILAINNRNLITQINLVYHGTIPHNYWHVVIIKNNWFVIFSELSTHHSAGTSPVFSNMRCTTLLPEWTGEAPKLKSTKALVCTGTLRRILCRVAMA